jgi:hypothetical protein
LYENPLWDDSRFTPADVHEKEMWERRCDEVNKYLDTYTYEID